MEHKMLLVKTLFVLSFVFFWNSFCVADEVSGASVVIEYMSECANKNFDDDNQELCMRVKLILPIVAGFFILVLAFLILRKVSPFKISEIVKFFPKN